MVSRFELGRLPRQGGIFKDSNYGSPLLVARSAGRVVASLALADDVGLALYLALSS
jgi:hypothetical protein